MLEAPSGQGLQVGALCSPHTAPWRTSAPRYASLGR